MRGLFIPFLLITWFHGLGQADFVENRGQWPEQVAWRTSLPSGSLWVERSGFTWQFFDPSILAWLHPVDGMPEGEPIHREHSYRMTFVGASSATPEGRQPRDYYHNYYLGNDPSKWADHVPVFGMADLKGIYPGIDVTIYSNSGTLKYDFSLSPGADPSLIHMQFEGADSLRLDEGALVIHTSLGEVREQKPYAYQLIHGIFHEVSCQYSLEGSNVRFTVGAFNPGYKLIIDPEIAFSTFIGTSASNFGFTACDDSAENLISGAAVFANNYPTTPGAFQTTFTGGGTNLFDATLTKFSPQGNTLLYSTYLGGNRQETPHSLITDSQDNIILMGVTGSSNFPVTAGAYQSVLVGGPNLSMATFFTGTHQVGTDFFISKFSPAGTLLNSTYAGGSANDGLNIADQLFYNYGDAFRGQVNVDSNNNIFVASVVRGPFPVIGPGPQLSYGGGESDGIVMKFNPQLGTMLWSSYLGGNGADACYAIEFEENGNILIAGGTRSANFQHAAPGHDTSHNGQSDGFIVKLNPVTFAVIAGTFVGTTEYDQVYFIQTDPDQNIYVLGQTRGNMPITPGLFGQPNSGQFIRKFNNALNTELWTTRIGTGSGHIDISPTAFLVSDCGQIYFSGWGGGTNSQTCGSVYTCYATNSTTFGLPVTGNAFQSTTDGSDFYLCVLSQDATQLVYASFLGGSLSNEHVDGGTSRFNKNGSVYQAVCAGCQGNSDFPTTPGAWSSVNPSFGCNMAVFRFNLGQAVAQVSIDGPNAICINDPAQFVNESIGANQFFWDFGDGITSDEFQPAHAFTTPGTYTITLIATDEMDCVLSDTTSIQITILPNVNPTIAPVNPICAGQQAQLNASGSPNLTWDPDPTLSATNIPNPLASPTESTTYFVTDFNACGSATASVTVQVFVPTTTITPDQEICTGGSVDLTAGGGATYQWSPNTGLSSVNTATVSASPPSTTTYIVTITTADGCVVERSVTVIVSDIPPGGITYPSITICRGSSTQLFAEAATTWTWTPSTGLSNPFIQNPIASPQETTTYFVDIVNPCGFGTSQVTVNVTVPQVEAFGGGVICFGQSISASASGGLAYTWSPPGFASPPYGASTLLSPSYSTWIVASGVDENGCVDQDSVYVQVLPLPEVDAGPDQYFVPPEAVTLFGNTFGLGYSWSPPDYLSCTDCPFPQANPPGAIWYTLTATDEHGCTGTDAVFVKPYFPIWVPNTITPNNDGLNDVFFAYGAVLDGFRMRVYDRWGILIFESTDQKHGWDGGINGYYVQNDTYIWVVEYDSEDRRKQLTGHVNVVR